MRNRIFIVACGLAVAALGVLPAQANILINVDKSTQSMSVTVDGALKWQWKVSTGRSGHDTPSGDFRPFGMEAMHYSKKYDNAPMPHSIFFTQEGHAIHGTLDAAHLGLPASHGCIRLDQANATALFALVRQEGVANTTVVVTGNAALARRTAPKPQPVAASTAPIAAPARPAVVAPSYAQNVAPSSVAPRTLSDAPSAPPAPPPGYPPFPRAWP
jgi:hypothetical protein